MKKKALVLGSTGQDGSYLIEFLLKKKYQVHGLIRKSATGNTKNINHLINDNKILQYAREEALKLLEVDPNLDLPENVNISRFYRPYAREKVGWSRIS